MPLPDGAATGRGPAPAAGTPPRLRPLDEDDGVVEVALEIAPLGVRHAVEAIEVEVRDVGLARDSDARSCTSGS